MNLEEARKIYWLKSYHKTLGDLLDEGYLNRSRLEWAAEKAWNPDLKEAAIAILESMKNVQEPSTPKGIEAQIQAPKSPLEIGISIDKARATLWPFSPHKGKNIGELLDTKQISLKDLGYAIENAWDNKVRQAAIALSLIRLEQVVKEPVPDAGFVNIVSGGRSYSEKEQVRLTFLQGIVFGFVLMLLIVLTILAFASNKGGATSDGRNFLEFISTPTGLISLIFVLAIYVFVLWLLVAIPEWISKRLDKIIEEHRFGQEGEEKTLQAIVQSLDGNWSVFQNVSLPGRNKADLDLVLVGPPGVWALEVKNFRGSYRNIGDKWEYRKGKNWNTSAKSPSQQALNNAVRLGNFLKADNINAFVIPIIIWANQESLLTIENPTVAIWQINRLSDELGNIWQTEKLSTTERKKIHQKLSMLCERQKEKK